MTRRSANHAGTDALEFTDGGKVDGRRARSQRTSSRVLAASRDLFLEQGYARTSMESVAARAGVSAQTVYNQFGTKCDLLAAVLDRAIAGDAAPVAVIERSWFAAGDAEPAADAIARFAAAGTAILARVAPVYDNRRRRRADQRHLIGALAAKELLRPDLDAEHAADVVYGLVNEDVYLLLTADCRWSRKRFATWLAATLLDQLVTAPDPPPVGRGRRRAG